MRGKEKDIEKTSTDVATAPSSDTNTSDAEERSSNSSSIPAVASAVAVVATAATAAADTTAVATESTIATIEQPSMNTTESTPDSENTSQPTASASTPQSTSTPQSSSNPETETTDVPPEETVVAENTQSELSTTVAQISEREETQKKLMRNYRSNVLKLTYLNTQYPKRAMDLKQEGLVVLKVTLSRKGKLLDVDSETDSKHRLLNNAARNAVKKSAPFPAAPSGLDGPKIELSLPFNFKL